MKTQPARLLQISSTDHPILRKLWAAGNDLGLIHFSFGIQKDQFLRSLSSKVSSDHSFSENPSQKNALPAEALRQVEEYLAGERQSFSLPIDWQQFTRFQADVYQAVIAIPYGLTRTYSQIAAQIGRPNAARAVGAANAANPVPIIIPCHRLVGKDGSLRGYGGKGGIQTKQWLLDHEKHHLAK